MSEEETADRSAKTRGKTPRSGSAPRDPAAPAVESPQTDRDALIQRLAGKPASEILARITNGDPLRLYSMGANRTRETYFVLDPDRLFERALSIVAVGIEVDVESCLRPGWLLERIDQAIRHVIDQDGEEERAGTPAQNPERNFTLFVKGFFVDPLLARGSAVRVNGLEERVRKGFYHLLIEGRSVEECLEMGLGPPDRLHEDILTSLKAVGLLDERGFEDEKEAEPTP